MNKRQLIESIQKHNPSATQQFLNQFAESDLQQYLSSLENARAKHDRVAGWNKPFVYVRKAG